MRSLAVDKKAGQPCRFVFDQSVMAVTDGSMPAWQLMLLFYGPKGRFMPRRLLTAKHVKKTEGTRSEE